MKISNEKVVSIHYTLKNDDGIVLDSSKNAQPLTYLHGKGNIIPGLEEALLDNETGSQLKVVIPPANAYGVRNEKLVQEVPLERFQDPDKIKEGVQIQIKTDQGENLATITKISGNQVTLDMNHPLADETLHFDVEVVEIREATAEEIAHGHVHGPGGHHH
jgi:FKBP-type peptidyl-prolyl cis-trans isomerase SlyD